MNQRPYIRLRLQVSGKTSTKIIINDLLREISQPHVSAGVRLPPVRVLAHQLQVSKNTVATAYAELAARGQIRPDGRRGYFAVRDRRIETKYSDPIAAPRRTNAVVGTSKTSVTCGAARKGEASRCRAGSACTRARLLRRTAPARLPVGFAYLKAALMTDGLEILSAAIRGELKK
jgi:DNA-binding transcriptional regulator YhcF (GntR family)